MEKVERTDEQNRFFRFHVSCTFDDPKTIDEEKIVNAFYDTLKEIYSYNTLKNRLEEVFYTKRKIWIKGVKLTVTFTSATPIEPLKRSLTQHFGLYLYPHRGPEFGVIPYQTDFEEYSLNGLRKLNLYLYFPRPYDFLFDVKKELPFELDDKTRQAVDYCYLGRFHEAKTFLDMGIGGLTADKYILVGGRWNIDKAKEIYENLGIDFNAKDLNTPKYFIYSDLDEIKMLREVNRLVSESVDLFIESKDMERDAFEGDKVMEDIILREAQRLREKAYLPYPSNITALIFILQALSREVKNDMKKVM